jgi:hypothetical protein
MLGFILAPLGHKVPGQYPNEINYSYGGGGSLLCPPDPGQNTRGEQAFYSDTHLGAIPTDAELATAYQYTPVATGWIAAEQGYFPGPWVPPAAWNPAGAYGPPMSLSGAPMVFYKFGMSPLLWGLVAASGLGALLYYRKKKGR